MRTWVVEWNIAYIIYDGVDAEEYLVVLPSLLKVLLWFIRAGRKSAEIHIWKKRIWKGWEVLI